MEHRIELVGFGDSYREPSKCPSWSIFAHPFWGRTLQSWSTQFPWVMSHVHPFSIHTSFTSLSRTSSCSMNRMNKNPTLARRPAARQLPQLRPGQAAGHHNPPQQQTNYNDLARRGGPAAKSSARVPTTRRRVSEWVTKFHLCDKNFYGNLGVQSSSICSRLAHPAAFDAIPQLPNTS